MNRTLFAALAAASLALPAHAQQRPDTILVLDASGSMWGQIDGVNKITIARDVVRDFVADFPADENLGLVAYGHRERGQCSDIETIVTPALGTGEDIARIVAELNPRGMTPMTDAVIAAAQALRHTEQAATVILISDGIETCNPDPCAAARALNDAGVDFTAHVIGFDVRGEAEALLQMQCIADETGGRFLTADNAEELYGALEQLAVVESGIFEFVAFQNHERMGPEPVFFRPDREFSAEYLAGNVSWEISDSEYSYVQNLTGNPTVLDLPFGDYVVTVTADAWDQPVQTEMSFAAGSIHNLSVMFPPREPDLAELTLRAVMDSANGPLIDTPITWEFSQDGDSFEFDGNPGVMEVRPGTWTITGYHAALEQEQSLTLTLAEGQRATQAFVFETPTAPLPTATLIAPAQVVVGSAFAVGWTAEGEVNPRDYITIVPVGAEPGTYQAYTRLEGRPGINLRAPADPGRYELRFQTSGEHALLATAPIEVIDVPVTVTAPAQVVVGSAFNVTWEAPGLHPRDYVTIVPMGAEEGDYADYDRLEGRASGSLRAPIAPGLYEVRLQLESVGRIMARTPLEVLEGDVTVSGPERLRAGSDLTVAWTGAIHPRDYVTIVPAGTADGEYAAYIRVGEATQGKMTAPTEPGAYEIRYQLERVGRVMARAPFEVLAADAALDDGAGLQVPSSGKPGEIITVSWSGGSDSTDQRVALARADQADFSWIIAESAIGRSSLEITLPDTPGRYELRFLDVAGQAVLGRSIIEVVP